MTEHKTTGCQGFSLLELMVVVGIMSVLATLAIPKFRHVQAKAKQSEAKGNLHHIHTLMEIQFIEKNSYVNAVLNDEADPNWIGWTTPENSIFDYSLTEKTPSTWTGKATSKEKLCSNSQGLNYWTIDEQKSLQGIDGCG
jgi:prepilin-type N-terminal cleavage/methylation domain-containing protein